MRLDDLREYGLPSRLIDRWRERQGERLLSIQRKAVQRGILDTSVYSRFLICAPTGSGKSFCAELALAQALMKRRKVILVFPLKALAEQKYRQLRQTYEPLGLQVIISTADRPEFEDAFNRVEYNIAITIYEKLDRLLTAHLDVLQNIGLIVLDELQSVFEPGRGEVVERLLIKVTSAAYQPTLIGLSAVITEGSEAGQQLAEWLGATLIEDSVRPVDLLRGIAVNNVWRYRSFNTGTEGEEPMAIGEESDRFDGVMDSLVAMSEPTLVFLKSRRETVAAALEVASRVGWPPAAETIAILVEDEESYLTRTLRQTLSRGVAFHNSDLTHTQRMAIENGFIAGEIRLIISTTTLSVGIDLPASTVYLETVKYRAGCYGSRPGLVPISRAEFDNMTGRAGRLTARAESEPGRAVVIARSEFERDVLWQTYIKPGQFGFVEEPNPGLAAADWLLDLIVCGIVSGPQSAEALARRRLDCGRDITLDSSRFSKSIDVLVDSGFVARESLPQVYQPTSLGRTVALAGLTVEQANYYLRRLHDDIPACLLEWLFLALSGPGWQPPPGLLSQSEHFGRAVESVAAQRLIEPHQLRWLGWPSEQEGPLSFAQTCALKASLLLDDWSRGEGSLLLEERYQIPLGQIQHLGETAAYLLTSVLKLAGCERGTNGIGNPEQGWVFSVRYGLPFCLADCFFRFRECLNRADFLTLFRAGITGLTHLLACPPEELNTVAISERKIQQINEKCKSLKLEVDMEQVVLRDPAIGPRLSKIAAIPQSIEVDGESDGERYLVKIDGFPVRLTGKSFKYFTKLAWSRVHRDAGWIYKEDIEVGFNQARYLYRMKHEVADSLGHTWPIYENNRLGYYRLMADPSRIKLNQSRLKEHPDYEVRSLFESGGGQTIN